MTETSVDMKVLSGVSNLLPNTPLEEAMHEFRAARPVALRRHGPRFRREDPGDADGRGHRRCLPPRRRAARRHAALRRRVPLAPRARPMIGSTDVGDVSWVVPTVQARGATYAIGTPGHSWQLTAQGKTPAAHKGMVHVAKVMAGTAVDAIVDQTLVPAPRPTSRPAPPHALRVPDTARGEAAARHVEGGRLTQVLDHVSVTVADLARSGPFWDAVMEALGVARRRGEGRLGYGVRNRAGDDSRSVPVRPREYGARRGARQPSLVLPRAEPRGRGRLPHRRSRIGPGAATARPASAPPTIRTTTPLSCSTRTATGSRPSATGHRPKPTIGIRRTIAPAEPLTSLAIHPSGGPRQ